MNKGAIILAPCVIIACSCTHNKFMNGYVSQWESKIITLSTNDIPIPLNTPYDDNGLLKKFYIEGYIEGIEYAKEKKGNGAIGILFVVESDLDQAKAQGWHEGRRRASEFIHKIQKELEYEAKKAHSKLNHRVGFHANGQLWYLFEYDVNSFKNTNVIRYVEWFNNGNKKKEMKYDENEEPIGLDKQWYRNGTIREQKHWKNGEINGQCKGYYPNGRQMYSLVCSNSIPIGNAKVWNEKGRVIAKGRFVNGEWRESVRIPGYIIDAPSQGKNEINGGKINCLVCSFSVMIDPKGPIANQYREFLNGETGITNKIIELRFEEYGLCVLTEEQPNKGNYYQISEYSNNKIIREKGVWKKEGKSYSFYDERFMEGE